MNNLIDREGLVRLLRANNKGRDVTLGTVQQDIAYALASYMRGSAYVAMHALVRATLISAILENKELDRLWVRDGARRMMEGAMTIALADHLHDLLATGKPNTVKTEFFAGMVGLINNIDPRDMAQVFFFAEIKPMYSCASCGDTSEDNQYFDDGLCIFCRNPAKASA